MVFEKTERAFLVEKWFETKSIIKVQRAWRAKFNKVKSPDHKTIRLPGFKRPGALQMRPRSTRPERTKKSRRIEDKSSRHRQSQAIDQEASMRCGNIGWDGAYDSSR